MTLPKQLAELLEAATQVHNAYTHHPTKIKWSRFLAADAVFHHSQKKTTAPANSPPTSGSRLTTKIIRRRRIGSPF